jgi:hypothetical protein
MRGLKAGDWVKEVVKYGKGLKQHGMESKQGVLEWIKEGNEERNLFNNINSIVLDFVD